MKKLLLAFAITAIGLTSCKKEDMSKYATKEDLEQSKVDNTAKIYNFTLTFGPGTTYQFSPFIYKEKDEDVVLTFIHWSDLGGSKTWVQCPITVGLLTVYSEFTGTSLIINTVRSDGQAGSPLNATENINFRAVVIPVSQYKENPNTDWSNYKEVSKTLNLTE